MKFKDIFLRYWDNVIIGIVAGLVVYYGIKIQSGLFTALIIFIFALLLTFIYSFFVWYDRKTLFKLRIIKNYNKASFWIQVISLLAIIAVSFTIYYFQIPKPDVSHQLYVNTKTGTLDIYFFNTGERAVILSNLSVYEVGSDTLTLSNRGLPEMISPFSDVKLISTNEKIKENTGYIINYCYIWGEDSKCEKIGPRPLKNVYKSNIDLSITFADSVSVSIIRVRNSSIINFEKRSLDNYETICYIENTGGNPEKYVIEDLNFSTDYIPPYGNVSFECQIKEGKVIKIIEQNEI